LCSMERSPDETECFMTSGGKCTLREGKGSARSWEAPWFATEGGGSRRGVASDGIVKRRGELFLKKNGLKCNGKGTVVKGKKAQGRGLVQEKVGKGGANFNWGGRFWVCPEGGWCRKSERKHPGKKNQGANRLSNRVYSTLITDGETESRSRGGRLLPHILGEVEFKKGGVCGSWYGKRAVPYAMKRREKEKSKKEDSVSFAEKKAGHKQGVGIKNSIRGQGKGERILTSL